MNLYFAANVNSNIEEIKNGHVTLIFSTIVETKRISMKTLSGFFPSKCKIERIEFFENAGVNVAIVSSPELFLANDYFKSIGLNEDLKFKPHITLSHTKKNDTEYFKHLIGEEVELDDIYLKLKDF